MAAIMALQRHWVTVKGVLLTIGFMVLSAIVSAVVALIDTSHAFAPTAGEIGPPPGAGIYWMLASLSLFIGFLFFGLFYLIESLHTYLKRGSRVRWLNYGLRVALALLALIGPFWMADVHPTLDKTPSLLLALNITVGGVSIGLMLVAFLKRLSVGNRPKGKKLGDPQAHAG
jgi:hypothetical protein